MRRWSISSLMSRTRRAALSSRRPVRPIVNRTRLWVEPLETRIVPDAVGPGADWDDGHWVNGVKVGVTVYLHNSGPGWLEVGGGGGAVSVSPGAPPTPPDPYGGEVPPPELPPPDFAFSVYGALGDGSGDVTWSGDADSLYIQATGDVSPVHIGGDLYVDAAWTIGNLAGHDVTAHAGKSVGNVSASQDVGTVSAGTTAGAVSAARNVYQLTAGQSVGAVTAGGNVTTLSAGTSTSSVSAGGWLGSVHAGLDVGGSVSAGLSIGGAYVPGAGDDYWAWYYATYYGGVSAGRDVVGSVTAGGSVVAVSAGRDILGPVSAGVDVWSVYAGGGGVFVPDTSDPDEPDRGEWVPYAPGRVVGGVTAGRDVHAVEATGDVLGAVRAGAGFVRGVRAGGSVAGAVTAQTDVGRSVTRAPDPDWRPFWYFSTPSYPSGVTAEEGDVSGAVTATTGEVTWITAGRDVGGAVTAGRDVGSVSAGRHVAGAVTAGRDVGSVRAGGGREMPVSSVTPGDVSADVTAGRDVGDVSASRDVTGSVSAGHGVGDVAAGRHVSGDVTAGASVGRLDDADPHLPQYHPYWSSSDNHYWGDVRAGGDVTGSVSAGIDVTMVEAWGTVSGSIDAGRDVGFVHGTAGVSSAVTAGRDFGRLYAGGYGYTGSNGVWGELPGAAPGHFTGSVTANAGDVYGVFATGDSSGPVSAGGGVAEVRAGGSVTGDVLAGDSIGYLGGLTPDEGDPGEEGPNEGELRSVGAGVLAGLDVDSAIAAGGDVTAVRAGNNLAGSVTAGRDIGSARAGRNLTATLGAGRDIGALSAGRLPATSYPDGAPIPGIIGSITTTATAGRDIRSATATGDIATTLTAGHAIGGIYAQGSITGTVEATTGPVGRLTDEPPPPPPYSPYYFPYMSESDAPGAVHADMDIDATITAGIDVTWVEAKGNVAGTIAAGRDIGRVQAEHSISADADAGRDLPLVRAGVPASPPYYDPETGEWVEPPGITGDITGDLTAGQDVVTVTATGSIDSAIVAGNRVTAVTANVDVAGSIDAGEDVVTVTAGRHVSSAITAGRDVRAVSAGTPGEQEFDPDTGEYDESGAVSGDVSGPIDAERDVLMVTATQDVSGDLTAGRNIDHVEANRDVSGVLTAESGGIRLIRAGRDITGGATAEVGIGYLPGEIPPWELPYFTGPIVAQVDAGRDITGDIVAITENIGWVKGYVVNEGAEDEYEYARYGGGVLAGRHIDGDIRAEEGGIAAVVAGAATPDADRGRLGGFVFAKRYDLSIAAAGEVTKGADAGWGVDLTAGGDVTGVVTARDGKVLVTAAGDVDAATRGRRGVTITARDGVAGSVIAGDDEFWADATVMAGNDVAAPVTASGAAYIAAGGGVTGTVEGWGDVGVYAGGDVGDRVTSKGSAASVTAGGSVAGTVSGVYGATVTAGGSVSGTVAAGNLDKGDKGRAEVTAQGDVTATVTAVGGVVVTAGGAVSGPVSTDFNTVIVSAGGTVSGAVSGVYAVVEGQDVSGPVAGHDGVEARAHGDITATLNSSAGDVFAWAGRDVTAAVNALWEVYIEAGGDVSGDVSAGGEVTYANATVRALGNVSGAVRATERAEAWAGKDITGDVVAGTGEAIAIASGYVSGVVSSGADWLRVWAPKGTGRAMIDYPGSPPGSDWLMVVVRRDAGGDVFGSLIANEPAGPQFVAATAADPPAGQPGGPNDDRGRAKGAVDGLKQKPRVPTLPTELLENFRNDWTPEEFGRQVNDLTDWWGKLKGEDAELLQEWWSSASADARKELIRGLLGSFSDTQRDYELYKRIGPPPPEPGPPAPEPGPPAKAGPTDAELKKWSDDVNLKAKQSATVARLKVQQYDNEGKLRDKVADAQETLAKQIENLDAGTGKHAASILKYRTWAAQLRDRVNFGVANPGDPWEPIPLTDEGKRQAAALKAEIDDLKAIAKMTLEQKLERAFRRALEMKDKDGNNVLEGELRDAVLELVKPENLAIMGGAMVGLGVVAFTPAGPPVLAAATVLGYLMTGKAVIEIGEHVFKFVGVAADASRPQDFDVAADHLIKALKEVAGQAVPALAGVGAVKVVKGAANLKAAKAAEGADAKKLVQRRADGKMQLNDGQPPPPQPNPNPGAAQAGAQPVPIVPVPVRRHPPGKVPKDLTDEGRKAWEALDGFFGEKVMTAIETWAKADGSDLSKTLVKLQSALEKTIGNPSQSVDRGKQWSRWTHLTGNSSKRPTLEEIVGNKTLKDELAANGRKLEDLVTDLDAIAHLPGAPAAFKSLSNTSKSVKGDLAEIRAAARDMPNTNGISVEFKTKIDDTIIKLPDGTNLKIPKGTDADVVSKNTLWQLKVGEFAIDNPGQIEAWARQAAEAVKAKSVPNGAEVGVRLDKHNAQLFGVDNAGNFVRDTNYKTMWERVKAAYPDVKFKIEIIP
jgi:hypothetical protein